MIVDSEAAHLAAHQHTAWMLVNLLARADRVVSTVRVVCPPGVPLAGRVVPLAARDLTLDQALVQGGKAVDAVPVGLATGAESEDVVLVVGAQTGIDDHGPQRRHVTGFGWWGGVSSHPAAVPAALQDSPLPFGSYIAATLAVAEIFLHVRVPQRSAPSAAADYGWDCWTQDFSSFPSADARITAKGLDLSGTALAGVGAVGSTWVHALWATPGLRGTVLLADADKQGVTVTNLNRCPLFGHQHLNHPKAESAAKAARDCAIAWGPRSKRFEALGVTPQLLVSAVDTNRAREALQGRYPAVILSASTSDLRAEALRVGPPGVGACLRCYNVPEAFVGDDDLRALARAGGAATVAALAAGHGVSPEEVQRWLDQGECGEVGTRLLSSLREQAATGDTPRFAVGFTSVMAGTILAAETIKVLLGEPLRATFPEHNNVTFQFLKPMAPANSTGVLARDDKCPACPPTNPAMAVWRRRASGFTPPQQEE